MITYWRVVKFFVIYILYIITMIFLSPFLDISEQISIVLFPKFISTNIDADADVFLSFWSIVVFYDFMLKLLEKYIDIPDIPMTTYSTAYNSLRKNPRNIYKYPIKILTASTQDTEEKGPQQSDSKCIIVRKP
jgi:hypothetical protein